MLDLGRLRALHAVATYGSIAAAATALGYTPSAVSQQIAKLEREVRTELLDRQGRRAALTPAGRLLAEAARDVLAALEQAEARLEGQRGVPAGRLVLAAFPTACRGLLPEVVAELAEQHAELDIRLWEIDPYRAVDLVVEGEVDVAVVHDWDNTPLILPGTLRAETVGVDVADAVLPAGHPLAARAALGVADLTDERWVSQHPGSMCHDWLLRSFAEQGRRPDVAYQVDEYQSQMAVVAAGVGVALVPRLGRGAVPPGVRVVPLHPATSRRIIAIWRPQSTLRPAVAAALAALRRRWPDPSPRPGADLTRAAR
ncbi:LysR family transcriptional regulator [Micromonospora purpureochromogenes]|uniref:LysR family transcriptional regulator n=1 Tax=Micromonospora TaxID=1873 RepID=UPI003408C572